jgi:hypothetical protein
MKQDTERLVSFKCTVIEHRVFEYRVLRRIFGPKRDKVTGDGRKLYNEELHKFYSSPNVIRMFKSRRHNGMRM